MLSYLPQFKQRFINLMFQFQQSIFQISLKITLVVPIFKKGVKTNPISMLSMVSKIRPTEKIMSKQIQSTRKSLMFYLQISMVLGLDVVPRPSNQCAFRTYLQEIRPRWYCSMYIFGLLQGI